MGQPSERTDAALLGAMTTPELLELLERTLDGASEDTYDGELVDALLAELNLRSPLPEHRPAAEAYGEFSERVRRAADAVGRRKGEKRYGWRNAFAGVMVAAALLLGMMCAQASGLDIFGAAARWSDELFSFGRDEPEPTAALSVGDIEKLLPSVPEGFVMGEQKVFSSETDGMRYMVRYTRDDEYIAFYAAEQSEDTLSSYQKDYNEVGTVTIGEQECGGRQLSRRCHALRRGRQGARYCLGDVLRDRKVGCQQMRSGEYERLSTALRRLLSERVRECRLELGLSQEHMAERLYVSCRTYGNLERGVYCFSALPLIAFLALYGAEARNRILNDFSSRTAA